MISKLVCFLIGHTFREKAFTGKTYEVVDRLTGGKLIGQYYVWKKCDQCPRCGKKLAD